MFVKSNIRATFPCNLQSVWQVVTSLTDYSWRSDVEEIEVISDTQFVEITKSGYMIPFMKIYLKYRQAKYVRDLRNVLKRVQP